MKQAAKRNVILLLAILCALCLGVAAFPGNRLTARAAEENISPVSDFENGSTTGTEVWGSGSVTINENADFVHGGTKSLKLPATWMRIHVGSGNDERWESGSYYHFSFWVKGSQAGAAITVYLAGTGSGPQTELLPWSNGIAELQDLTKWTQIGFDLAYEPDTETANFTWYIDGKTVETAWFNLSSIGVLDIMINNNVVGDIFIDDVSLTKQPLVADTVVNVLDSEGTPVEDAVLTVYDESGTALTQQPEIVFAENA